MAKRGPFLKFESDDKAWIASINKSIAATDRLEEALRATATQGKQSGKNIETSFKGASSGAASFITQAVGVTAVIAKITQAFGEMRKAQEEAFAGIAEAEFPFSRLAQVAGGDADRLRGLINESKALFLQGGATSLGGAADITFALESAGLLDQRRLFGELFGVFQQPEVLANALATTTTAFGAEEAGTFKAIIGKGLAASAFGPSKVAELLEAASKPAVFAARLGLSDEEALAATTLVTKALGGAAQGGTSVASFFQAAGVLEGVGGVPVALKRERLAAQGFTAEEISEQIEGKITPLFEKGQSLQSIVEQVSDLNLSAAQLKQFFPKKASVAFGLLESRGALFDTILTAVQESGEIDVDRAVRARLLQPEIVAARDRRKGAAARVIGQEELGVAEAVAQTVEDKIIARTEGGIFGGFQRLGLAAARKVLPAETFVDLFAQPLSGIATQALRGVHPAVAALVDEPLLFGNTEAAEIDRLQGALRRQTRLDRGIGETPERAAFVEERLRPTRVLGDDLKGPS